MEKALFKGPKLEYNWTQQDQAIINRLVDDMNDEELNALKAEAVKAIEDCATAQDLKKALSRAAYGIATVSEHHSERENLCLETGYVFGRLAGFRLGLRCARLIRGNRLPGIPGAEGTELPVLTASAMTDDADAELIIGALLGADTPDED